MTLNSSVFTEPSMTEPQTKYYLYSDGSRFPKINRSGFGGYIMAETHNMENLNFYSLSTQTLVEFTQEIKEEEQKHNFELWGIITGLEIAQEMGIKNLTSRCDDKTLMLHINNCMSCESNLDNVWGNKRDLIKKVLTLVKNFDSISFQYVPRNENRYSDSLSRKYMVLLERNFLTDHNKLLNKSKDYFIKGEQPPHSVYFHAPHMTMVPFEHNPFLVSQRKNKKQKEFRRTLDNRFDSNWELEAVYQKPTLGVSLRPGMPKMVEEVVLKKFSHSENNWEIVQSFMPSKPNLNLSEAIEIFNIALDTVRQTSKNPWFYSNIEKLTDVFHQKKPLSREIFEKFYSCSKKISTFDNFIYHRTPRDIEMKIRERLDKNKRPQLSIEETMVLMQETQNYFKRNKYFGQLMGLMIKELKKQNKHISDNDKENIKNELLKKYPEISLNTPGANDFALRHKMKM